MFGKNEITSRFPHTDGSLLVNDIWPTIQGEGPDAGLPAVFVRLAKCNLRCHFCDTEFDAGTWYGVTEALFKVFHAAGTTTQLVVITGGEPLLQNVVPFITGCNSGGLRVSIETAGTVMCPGIEYLFSTFHTPRNLIVCSPKTPKLNEELIPLIGAYKYILGQELDPDDGLPVLSTQIPNKEDRVYRPDKNSRVPVFVQPMDVQNPIENQANAELAAKMAMKYGHRLSLQLHKIVGVP